MIAPGARRYLAWLAGGVAFAAAWLAGWQLEPTAGGWRALDERVFWLCNDTLAGSGPWAHFWALASHPLLDVVAVAYYVTIYLASMASEHAVLARGLQMPYTDGTSTVARLVRAKGWDAVDALYENLPQTSEQMLHLDKLLRREKPVPVELDQVGFRVVAVDVDAAVSVLRQVSAADLLRHENRRDAYSAW